MRVCALVGDLMDRSRLSARIPGIEFCADAGGCTSADVVIVDLARAAGLVAEVRACAPGARLVCFGPHVDEAAALAATAAGADVVLPRSRFFRDPATVVTEPPT
jgi:hypothetical protein